MQVLAVFKASYLWNIKHKRNLKTCLLGSLLILGEINYDFCRFGFPSQESRRNEITSFDTMQRIAVRMMNLILLHMFQNLLMQTATSRLRCPTARYDSRK